MKSGYLKNTIGGAILAVSMLFGIGIASSATAQAQYGYGQDRSYEREQRRRERERIREQRRRERANNGDWNRNNGDWNRGGRAADGYGNYGGSFDLRQTALNAGFADGHKEGRKDRDRNERFNYQDESGYQKATRDYSSSKGDRYTYQRYYREAFANGYADGYGGF